MTATSTPQSAVQTGAPSEASGNRAIIAILLVATFVVILNETIMSVALPSLMKDLSVSARTGQWLSTVFLLTLAVVIPTTGFLLQRLTTRQVFVTAMVLFSTGTLIAAVSPAFWLLLPARVVQASGTAMMLPLLITTILTLVPVERRGAVMGTVSIVISVAPAIGPTVSGIVLHFFPWRFMFILVLPIALAVLAFGVKKLQNTGTPGDAKLDVASVVLSVPGFGGIVYGLSLIGAAGPFGIPSLAFVGVGVLGLAAFSWRQVRLYRAGNPLPPHLYSHGSAILSTLQQVAGAAGTALLVAVYAGRSAALQATGAAGVDASLSGIQLAFRVAALIAIATVVLAAFMHQTKPVEGAEPSDAELASRGGHH